MAPLPPEYQPGEHSVKTDKDNQGLQEVRGFQESEPPSDNIQDSPQLKKELQQQGYNPIQTKLMGSLQK